jgi:hypothetical protein
MIESRGLKMESFNNISNTEEENETEQEKKYQPRFFDKNRGAFDTQTGKIKEIYLPK